MRLVCLISAILLPVQALACSCLPGDYDTYLDWAEIAFIGTLVSAPPQTDDQMADLEFVFRVDEPITELPSDEIKITTRLSSAACGLGNTWFGEAETQWIIFAEKNRGNTYRVSSCGGSQKMSPDNTKFQDWLLSRSGFKDVLDSHPQSEAINSVLQQKIIRGYPDQTFRPENHINRAEFAKIIIESSFAPAEIRECSAENLTLKDVSADSWYAPYACVALDHGILSGYPDQTFRPEQNINLAETSKILARTFFPQTAQNYPLPDSLNWYQDFIDLLQNRNILTSEKSVFPQSYITRGDMAEYIWLLLK